jgi:6-phosphogluconolactonase (cycloisomerase 2 family)
MSRVWAFLASSFIAAHALGSEAVGHVYVTTNEATGNRVIALERQADGSLQAAAAVSTGGLGTGAGLGNQGALALSRNGRWLAVVNAGSDSVSLLEATAGGLALRDVAPSGGQRPVSVTVDGDRLYVLHAGGGAGGVDGLAGFSFDRSGRLAPIPGAQAPLSAASTAPAQVAFAAHGRVLVVTEKATNLVDTFVVRADGSLDGPFPHASAGSTPFGFAVSRDRLVVSEAAGGQSLASSASSYELEDDGSLEPVTPVAPTHQTAACWVAVTPDGRFAYTANPGSSSITGFSIDPDGAITALDATGLTASTGPGSRPLDLATSRDGRFLYVVTPGTGTVTGFSLGADGALAPLGATPGIPGTATGIAAR